MKTFDEVDRLGVVEIAVGGEKYLGLDLPEAVEDALRAEVGRARGPRRPEAGRGEHRDDRAGYVGQVGGDPVPGLDPGGPQGLGQARHLGIQLGVGDGRLEAFLAPEDEGDRAVPPPEQVLREIETGLGKPPRARHFASVGQRDPVQSLADDAAEGSHGLPELRRFGYRPAMQRGIVVGLHAPAAASLLGEGGEARAPDALGDGMPQRLFCHKARVVAGGSSPICRPAYSGRMCGNRMTSRIEGLSVSSMTSRSMPMPAPEAGGIPYSRARM
jgi:hypothetical protein